MSVTVYAPASIGNVGVGFDLLGAALAPLDNSFLGDRVTVSVAPEGIQLRCSGRWQHKLPGKAADNIVMQCAEYFLAQLPVDQRTGLSLELEKNLPVGSGLGSSASSVVAAFVALNEFFVRPFDQNRLLLMMGEFEGKVSGSVHFDNVAPGFLGGIQLMLQAAGRVCEPVPVFDNWYWVIAYPGISLSTAHMRSLLPAKYDRATAIDYGRYLSAFIHASYRQDQTLAVAVLKDVMAEPYRSSSISGYVEARAKLAEMGMLASGISGSGPTMFSITDDLQLANQSLQWLTDNFLLNSDGFAHICRIDKAGARLVSHEKEENQNATV